MNSCAMSSLKFERWVLLFHITVMNTTSKRSKKFTHSPTNKKNTIRIQSHMSMQCRKWDSNNLLYSNHVEINLVMYNLSRKKRNIISKEIPLHTAYFIQHILYSFIRSFIHHYLLNILWWTKCWKYPVNKTSLCLKKITYLGD